MHQVQLSDSAYQAFSSRAKALGLTVEEYLNDLGNGRYTSGFVLTSEMRAGIAEGLEDIENGRVHSTEQVVEHLESAGSGGRRNRAENSLVGAGSPRNI